MAAGITGQTREPADCTLELRGDMWTVLSVNELPAEP
jgi:hypothetical protein